MLAGQDGSDEEAGWVLSDGGRPRSGSISSGVYQIECLVSVLDQLVFAETIFVMGGDWSKTWQGRVSSLDRLLGTVIQPVPLDDRRLLGTTNQWLNDLITSDAIGARFGEGMVAFQKGVYSPSTYWSQVINGAAQYLSIASALGASYAPHPARSKYLESTLWRVDPRGAWPPPGIEAFHNKLRNARVRLHMQRSARYTVRRLLMRVPSTAVLCILESSAHTSPIDVALQLREDASVAELRLTLQQLSEAITLSVDESPAPGLAAIDHAIRQVELRMAMPVGGATDNDRSALMTIYGVTSALPGGVNHGGLVERLVKSAGRELLEVLKKRLGFDNRQAVEDWYNWVTGNPEGTTGEERSELREILVRMQSVEAATAWPRSPEMLVDKLDVKQVNIGGGATIQAPVVIANSIEASFNQIEAGNPDSELKAALQALVRALARVEAAPDQLEELSDDVNALTKAASKPQPTPGRVRRALEGVRESARAIGESALPLIELAERVWELLRA